MFHLDPPPNFQGLRPDVDIDISGRNLPHWRQAGATYFVTFRLGDSIPAGKQKELKDIREEWISSNPEPHTPEQQEEISRLTAMQIEKWLDMGLGHCVLRDPANRDSLIKTFQFFDDSQSNPDITPRHEIGAWVIMPNHVHLLVRPLAGWDLSKLLQSWKRHSAMEINRRTSREGNLWMTESYNRIVRDPQHLWRCLQYIGNNPTKANLGGTEYSKWVKPEWETLGWKFDEASKT